MNEPQLYRLLEEGEAIQRGDVIYYADGPTAVGDSSIGKAFTRDVFHPALRPVPAPGWIPVSERMPTESDADTFRRVMWLDSNGSADTYVWNCNPKLQSPLIAWMPIPPYSPPKIDESREDFEAWLKTKYWTATDSLWEAWQAARATVNGKEGV